MAQDKSQETKKTKSAAKEKTPVVSYYEAVGRRKSASARVRLYVCEEEGVTVGGVTVKKGDMIVNGRPVEEYFPGDVSKKLYGEPLRTTNTIARFAVTVTVSGGGLSGQLGAVIHGLSRALEKVDLEKFRPILKKRGFLTRDARVRERRRPNTGGKARRQKQSPKR
jgi:small subunit ribosomal protein S9